MLTLIAPSIYTAETYFKVPAGGRLPLRMTVVVLTDGSLLLHAPTRIDDALSAQLAALGPVSTIVAPNCFHHLYAGRAKERYRAALLLGAPGLRAKCPDLPLDGLLGDETALPLRADFDSCVIKGAPRLGEVVFFHRASRTLLMTDFVFNMDNPPGALLRIVTSMMGNRRGLKQSRLLRFGGPDRAALRASAERILAWPSARVIMAHGAVLEGDDVVAHLRRALWWSLGEKKAS